MPRLTFGTRLLVTEDGTQREKEFLLFDGVEVEGNYYPYIYEETGKISVTLYERTVREQLSDLRVRDVQEAMHNFGVSPSNEHNEELDLIVVADEFEMFPTVAGGELVFACIVRFLWQSWNKPWSPVDFIAEMDEREGDFPEVGRTYEASNDSDSYQAIIEFPFRNWESRLLDELEENWNTTKRFIEAVDRSLQAKLNENSLVNQFNFPPEIRTSCEQYLLYFVQFLKDMGVDADAQIQHDKGELGHVLFSVTPADGKQALDKIRQALEIYLKLSQAPSMRPDFSAPDDVQTFQRQIRYLQNELDFAEGKIRHRDLTIELQESLIAKLKAERAFEQVPQEAAAKEDGKTALLKNTVYLKRFDAGIAEIDFATIYDLMRKWLTAGHEGEDLLTYFKKHGLKLFERSAPALPLNEAPALPPIDNTSEQA